MSPLLQVAVVAVVPASGVRGIARITHESSACIDNEVVTSWLTTPSLVELSELLLFEENLMPQSRAASNGLYSGNPLEGLKATAAL
jgi:hypothetical protein